MVPTHVGVYRLMKIFGNIPVYGPHACGGVPEIEKDKIKKLTWSPRMWGCTE